MKLRIVTPKSAEICVETDKVFLPGVCGKFEILPGHAPMVSALDAGEITWGGAKEAVKFTSGVVEVRDDVVTVAVQ